MTFGLKITVDGVTRVEDCDKTICLNDNVSSLGEKQVAAGLLGIQVIDIEKVTCVGNCNECKFHKFIKSKESY